MNTNVATSKQEVPKNLDDLYAVLGVSKSATQEEIKLAYRVAAMTYHPDRNKGDLGMAKVFQAVQHAYDVLSDPDKRKYYDETGKIKPTEQQLRAEAQDVLHANIISCIDALVQSPDPQAERMNPIQEVRNKLSSDIRNADQNLKLLKKTIKKYEQMAKRLKSKKNPQFENSPVGILISGKIENLKASTEKVANAIDVHNIALQMINDYSYEMETIVPGSVTIDPFGSMQTGFPAELNMFFQNFPNIR